MKVKYADLAELTRKAIRTYGYNEQEVESILDVLMYAQLRGNNQGIVKLIGAGIPKAADAGDIEIEKESPVSAYINGRKNHAMVVVNHAVDVAVAKAKTSGVSAVGVHGIATSSGALGYYAKKIAEQGLVGFVFAGSMETVAIHGSFEPMLGTNPLAVGVPGADKPLVLDLATAAMAYFGVVEANTAGRKLPEGIAYDKDGNETNDPAKVLDDGALRTFDKGHKGSGLSLMVQALTGPLVGAYFTGIGDVVNNWAGHFIIAFNPELFAGLEATRQGVLEMTAKVKAAKKLPGVEEIYVPSERGDAQAAAAFVSGELEVEDNLYHELEKVAAKS